VWFNETKGYSEAGRHIYDIAAKLNDNGDFFPLWGTCLGFELLTYLSANGVEHRADCSSNRQALPLVFKEGFRESRMFKNAPEHIVDVLQKEPVTSNFHSYCVTEKVRARQFHMSRALFMRQGVIISLAEHDGLSYRQALACNVSKR
jgi:gamma-glutamyl hydrolase